MIRWASANASAKTNRIGLIRYAESRVVLAPSRPCPISCLS